MTGVQTCALRSEEHTSELQSHDNLVWRLLLEKKTQRRQSQQRQEAPGDDPCTDARRARGGELDGRRLMAGPRRRGRWWCRVRLFFFLKDGAPPDIYSLPPRRLSR